MSLKNWHRVNNNARHNTAGDTIVEVMLSIAVVSMVIGISYSIANKSVKTGRAAQEQTEALQLAQQQLERVKVLAADKTKWASVTGAAPYCVVTVPAISVVLASNPNCKGQGSGNLYNLSVSYSSATNDTFTITTNWTNVNNIASSVSIAYRMHAP